MSFSALDKIQMTSTSTGTSNLVLNAAETGTLANSYGNFTKLGYDDNVDFPYAIVHKTSNEWEVGRGSFRSFNGTATYSLPNTTFVGVRHFGGVLAPNGEVHFAPFDDTRGMKLSPTGVVSTYTLLYTSATLGGLYRGAVLAQNGDVHFVPFQAQRGQKVSTSGTVSTYSLVLTGFGGAYSGGVLDENGEIHFIPYLADRGQKVSAAGVVSTYSIVNTAGSYAEGAIVNGEVHFIPRTATVGQKINVRTGLVSTYTLAYTSGGLDYEGGVKHINGDIHFIPLRAPVGQKISVNGVVSTYSLVYTASDAYTGGVLGRDGEIHFIPFNINSDVPIQVGQKISVRGTVSTYSLAFTSTVSPPYFQYCGGVLAQNGDIHYVPGFASRGQRVNFSQNVLIRREVEESTNSSNSLVNFSSGEKSVFIGYPAGLGQSTLPTGDNYIANYQGINDNSVALRMLQRKAARGSVFSDVTVSTYSIIISGSGISVNYVGGVLAPNGDIHFVPSQASRGQRVNYLTGAVSTYSLVFTTTEAYRGGVLSPDGSIHFIPYRATRGQRFSTSGVVSTYSLIYTTNNAYFGGVLAPNGDIHFVPFAAQVGQKVNINGIVSTYSLVHTASEAHQGGVLAPNGEIHFTPTRGIGQKISLAGVVSTYSLVTPQGESLYFGSVLAPNGDIHFINNLAGVGQKISPRGVVSTYSLAITSSSVYRYGILAPNGDIHYLPFQTAPRGQKISSTGIISTYSFPVTFVISYGGGVLAPNGDIHLVPTGATVGMKISTGSSIPFGEATHSFFNKL